MDEHKLPVIGANVVEKVRQMGLLPIWMENLLWQYRTMLFCGSLISVILRSEIPVKGNRQLNITLQEDSKSLDEVVVVGYGTQKKVNLTGSVDVITEEVLANRSAPTMSQLIQGASLT